LLRTIHNHCAERDYDTIDRYFVASKNITCRWMKVRSRRNLRWRPFICLQDFVSAWAATDGIDKRKPSIIVDDTEQHAGECFAPNAKGFIARKKLSRW